VNIFNPQISGVMALTTAFTSYRNTHAQTFRLLVIGSSDSDVIFLGCISLAMIGFFSVSVGVFKTARRCALSTNQVCTNKLWINPVPKLLMLL